MITLQRELLWRLCGRRFPLCARGSIWNCRSLNTGCLTKDLFFVGVTSDPEASFFSAPLSFTIFSGKGHSMPGCESGLSKSWDVKRENKMAFSYLPLEFSVNESILRLVSLFPGKWSASRFWCLPAPVSLGAARLCEGRVNTIRLPTRLSWGEVTQELAVGLSGRCCRGAPGGSVCLGRG